MADVLDAVEFLWLFTSFWGFLFSRSFRARRLKRFGEAGLLRRALYVVEAAVSTVCGLGPLLLIIWLLAQ